MPLASNGSNPLGENLPGWLVFCKVGPQQKRRNGSPGRERDTNSEGQVEHTKKSDVSPKETHPKSKNAQKGHTQKYEATKETCITLASLLPSLGKWSATWVRILE